MHALTSGGLLTVNLPPMALKYRKSCVLNELQVGRLFCSLILFFCYIRKEKLAIQSTLKLFELMLSSTVYNGCTANTPTQCEPVP